MRLLEPQLFQFAGILAKNQVKIFIMAEILSFMLFDIRIFPCSSIYWKNLEIIFPCWHNVAPELRQLSLAASEVGLYGRLNFLFGQVYGCGTPIIVDSKMQLQNCLRLR